MANSKTVNQMLMDRDIRFYELLVDERIKVDGYNWGILYRNADITVLYDCRNTARHIIITGYTQQTPAGCYGITYCNPKKHNGFRDRVPVEIYNAEKRVYGTATLIISNISHISAGCCDIIAQGIDTDNFISV